MIIGCATGSFYAQVEAKIVGEPSQSPVTAVVVGAGAMLAGYTRLTYSLVIIMLETTTSINLFIPMMVGIMVSRAVSGLFTRSLYERALRTKQMPVLRGSVPKVNQFLKMEHIMARPVITTASVPKVTDVRGLLETSHAAWPVFNLAGNLCGIIPRSVLIRLVAQRAWYNHSTERLNAHLEELKNTVNPSPTAASGNNSINDFPEEFNNSDEDKETEDRPINVINTGASADQLLPKVDGAFDRFA